MLRISLLLFAVFFSVESFSQPVENNPYQLVQQVAQRTFARIQQDRAKGQSNSDYLRVIIQDEMLPHVDHRFAAFKVLGKNFRQVPKASLDEYVDLFRDYLIATYASTLGFYDGQAVAFEPTGDFEGKRFVVVRAIIKGTDGPDTKIAFKVRKERKSGQWKAFDIVAEGISLVDSKRSEFSQLMGEGGFELVLQKMRLAVKQSAGQSPPEQLAAQLSEAPL